MIITAKTKKLFYGTEDCFIIAEAGVNHNGKLSLAKKLVDEAKKAGADAVKFQTFKAENLVTENAKITKYQQKNLRQNPSQMKMLRALELGYGDFIALKRHCDKKNIIFLSAPHSTDAIDFLAPLVPAFKIGSGDLTNIPFLKKVAKKKKPILLSTGMANLREVLEALKAIFKSGNRQVILLHCTTHYPCPLSEVNLKAMMTLKKKFNLPVGYSDHTEGILAAVASSVMGAKVIEKHITLDKNLHGPDHKASLNPAEFREMVSAVRMTKTILGSGIKQPTKSEQSIKKLVRKSVVAVQNIKKGQIIKENMLAVKRPGTGIEPKYFDKIVGRKAAVEIKKDSLIKWQMV